MNTVERVARAIQASMSAAPVVGEPHPSMTVAAHAAIAAMREPSDAMVVAVASMDDDCPLFEDEWGAAIDAALAEGVEKAPKEKAPE